MVWVWLSLVLLTSALVAANAIGWPRVPDRGIPAPTDSVSICIPARNEEAHLDACLEAALAQGPAVREVRVYDDASTDATPEILARRAARDPRVRPVAAAPLPEGWTGKTHAAARAAADASGDWLIFLDCDTRLQPGAVDRLLAEADRRGVGFLAPWPGLDLHGFAEKLFMPLLNFSVFSLFPAPISLLDMRPSLGLAHGACLLMRRAEYAQIGGHGAVRGELFEDTAMARAWRAAGRPAVCLDGQDLIRVRMYDSLGTLWRGFQKIIYPAFRHELSFWAFLAFHAVAFVAPLALLPTRPIAAAALLLPPITARAIQALRFGYPFWSALLHAPAEAGLLLCGLAARLRVATGRGVIWKGRAYHGRG
jgi:glycosyltransferase involved in cell wall biosynthesis